MTSQLKEQKLKIIRDDMEREKDILKILLDLQYTSEEGYIDQDTANLVAKELNMTQTRVYEIISYYAMLESKPTSKFVIQVCNSSPCHFSGAKKITDILEKKLGVSINKSTPDGLFSYCYMPCTGACDIGPVIKIKDTLFGDLTEDKVNTLIDDLTNGNISI